MPAILAEQRQGTTHSKPDVLEKQKGHPVQKRRKRKKEEEKMRRKRFLEKRQISLDRKQ